MTKAERETFEHFAERYRVAPAEVSRRVELAVIGGDWGANGYTTMAQASLLARELGLRPRGRLLDLGARRRRPRPYPAPAPGAPAGPARATAGGLPARAAPAPPGDRPDPAPP